MTNADLSAVCRLADTIYPRELWESDEVFASRLSAFPKGCYVAWGDRVVGYIFFHPLSENSIVILNEAPILEDVNSLYIHDMAVEVGYRGKGIGKNLVQKAIDFADENRSKSIGLVAVLESNDFWDKMGFNAIEQIIYGGLSAIKRKRVTETPSPSALFYEPSSVGFSSEFPPLTTLASSS